MGFANYIELKRGHPQFYILLGIDQNSGLNSGFGSVQFALQVAALACLSPSPLCPSTGQIGSLGGHRASASIFPGTWPRTYNSCSSSSNYPWTSKQRCPVAEKCRSGSMTPFAGPLFLRGSGHSK